MTTGILRNRLILSYASILVSILATSATASVIRVKSDSTTNGPGNDWAHPFRTITAGLAAAQSGDEIWVAGGNSSRYTERVVLKDGVSLFGGFAGSETNRDERDWKRNVTLIVCTSDDGTVIARAGTGPTTVLDGFTIRHMGSPFVYGRYGAGIYCTNSSSSIINCRIFGSGAFGIKCVGSVPLIRGNTIQSNGFAGIYCNSSSPVITNNTITANGTGIYCTNNSSPNIRNNIVAFNAAGVCRWYGEGPILSSNCVYNPDGVNYVGVAPGIADISLNPKLVSARWGDPHIQPDSPCVNAGLDSAVQPDWKDVDGQPRTIGPRVDIGADESDGTSHPEPEPVIVRVSKTGLNDAAHDGSSWALAKATVQAGIQAASKTGGEVWVASGDYREDVTLEPYVYLYGGFMGREDARSQRNCNLNRSTLDGRQQGSVITAAPGYRVTAADGFEIKNAQFGIFCAYSSPSVVNNVISQISEFAIACFSSAPRITNNRISGSSSGITCATLEPAYIVPVSAEITNNTILGNGTGLYFTPYESPTATNNIVAFNDSGIFSFTGELGAPAVFRHNCVYNPEGTNYESTPPGAGDFSLDPMFVSRETGDYHLQLGSPCINAGLNSAVQPGWFDMDGEQRVLPVGGTVDIGADEYGARPVYSLSEAKMLAREGEEILLAGRGPLAPAVTTARFSNVGAFYLEERSRIAGIQCRGSDLLLPGQSAVVGGKVATIDGEMVLTEASVIAATVSQADVPAPLAMTNKSLGGGKRGLQNEIWRNSLIADPAGGWISRWFPMLGLSNVGLLVKTSGSVTASGVDPRANVSWFYINDGSKVRDGSGFVGVYCEAAISVTPPHIGSYVTVTGISGCEMFNGRLVNVLRVRAQEDIDITVPPPQTASDASPTLGALPRSPRHAVEILPGP